MTKSLVVDIETIGTDFDTLDEMSKEYLLKFADTEDKVQETFEGLAFSPLTGEISPHYAACGGKSAPQIEIDSSRAALQKSILTLKYSNIPAAKIASAPCLLRFFYVS